MPQLYKKKRSKCSLGECIATGLPGLVGAHGQKKVVHMESLIKSDPLANHGLFKSNSLKPDALQSHKTKGLLP
jgi:hypothetical protein